MTRRPGGHGSRQQFVYIARRTVCRQAGAMNRGPRQAKACPHCQPGQTRVFVATVVTATVLARISHHPPVAYSPLGASTSGATPDQALRVAVGVALVNRTRARLRGHIKSKRLVRTALIWTGPSRGDGSLVSGRRVRRPPYPLVRRPAQDVSRASVVSWPCPSSRLSPLG